MGATMTADFPTSSPPSTEQHYVHDNAPVTLSETAIAVLSTLPTSAKPILLSIDCPHVMNRIAELWTRPIQLDRYFEELTIDARGGRRGFALGVATEISNIREYYQTRVKPLKKTTWDFSV